MSDYWNPATDPYRYPNSATLRNLPGIRDPHALEVFEQRATALRVDEAVAAIASRPIDLAAWQAIHAILFQDVYPWAGQIRTVQLAKGSSVFAMPEHIAAQAIRIFSCMAREAFHLLDHTRLSVRFAYYFGELNVLHPFREGNGRTQKLLFDEIARRAGHAIDWSRMRPDALLDALIAVYETQDYRQLESLFDTALKKRS